jgi:hypothetical protein
MPVIERDVVLQGVDENGNHTVDLPITNLKNIVDAAEIKEIPVSGDMIPIIDSEDQGQMKKAPLEAIQQAGGGVDWAVTPFTGMTHFNNSSAFGCVWLETEKISSMARIIRGVAVLQVKAASWSSSQALKVSLPGGYPELTFKDASGTVTQTAGTGTGKLTMTSGGTSVSFVLNPDKVALAGGFYIGCVSATMVG